LVVPEAAPDTLPRTHRLQTRCGLLEYARSGEGSPCIVLFNGAGMTLEGWHALHPRIEELGTVIAWNRFGVEGSDAPRKPQSGALVIAAVRELLSYVAAEPPYVLVGHSIGGLYANLFARLHPAEVAGVLLLEATHPCDAQPSLVDETQVERSLAKVQQLPASVFSDNLHSEVQALDRIASEIDAAGPFPPVPLVVVSSASSRRMAHQRELATLSPPSMTEHILAQHSGHFPQLSEPELVLDALERLVRRSRRAS
jgi:pimeloyl-ACP methyl ester carboxylesterase